MQNNLSQMNKYFILKHYNMLENILKLEAVKLINKNEQKSIKGGLACGPNGRCPAGTHCETAGTFEGLCRKN